MVDEHSIPDSVTPADAAAEAAFLARVEADTRWQALHKYLVGDGFALAGAPRAYVAWRQGVLVRSVVAAEYSPVLGTNRTTATAAPSDRATLVLSIEADGTSAVQAFVLGEGTAARILRVTARGEVVTSKPDDPPPPGWP